MTDRERAIAKIKSNRKEAEEGLASAIEKMREDDDFDLLYRELNSLRWDFVKAKTDKEREILQDKIDGKENEINAKIAESRFPYNSLKVPYACEKCKDTGIFDGRICDCAERERIKISLNENVLLKDAPISFTEVDYGFYGAGAKEKKACADYVKKAIDGEKNIFLFAGKTGTGKTFFASVAARELLQKGMEVKAISAIKLNKELLEYHCSALADKREKWTKIAESDVMIIDDLGAEQILNNVTVPYLLELITERAEGKITFITTNLSPTELERRYGQRIVSRLLDKKLSLAVMFGGEDLRVRGRK